MRFFNTTGPCFPTKHYTLASEPRLPDVRALIDQELYFVLHAPRQSGKTTALTELARTLTGEGKYAALYVSCERAEAAQDDYGATELMLWDAIRIEAATQLPADCSPPKLSGNASGGRLFASLKNWAESCPRPIVLFLDEIDALRGESLRSVLRQLRDGFRHRPHGFPHSVVLCGLRDVRDYKAASGGDPSRLGTSSPFNIKARSLRLAAFSAEDVAALYGQHSAETGQAFRPEAVARACEVTGGQPWLVNAIASEVIVEMGVRDAITAEHVDRATERIILARQTHLDSLVARLNEPRVRRIIEPLIAGQVMSSSSYDDDFSYVRDLGLVAVDNPVRIANPIYREVIVRVLASSAQASVPDDPRSFRLPDGRLDEERIFSRFLEFWRENGDVLSGGMTYHEVAPQLVLMAFLQSVVNGRGTVDREYGVGRRRIDLLVRWPLDDSSRQRIAIELKVDTLKRRDPLKEGLVQLDDYLARMDLDEGWLVIFDRKPGAPEIWERGELSDEVTASGRKVRLLRA